MQNLTLKALCDMPNPINEILKESVIYHLVVKSGCILFNEDLKTILDFCYIKQQEELSSSSLVVLEQINEAYYVSVPTVTISGETYLDFNEMKSCYEAYALAKRLDAALDERLLFLPNQSNALIKGAELLLSYLSFDEAYEIANKVAESEIFCDKAYFLDYLEDVNIFESVEEFRKCTNLINPSVIMQSKSGKVIQIFK